MTFDEITAPDWRLAHDLHLLEARQQFAEMITASEKNGAHQKSVCVGIMQNALIHARLYGLRARRMEDIAR